MADPKGFLNHGREVATSRPVEERVKDWNEVYVPGSLLPIISKQASRCMDCGIPFCHNGCPLGNLIPEWNDYAYREDWGAASERLHATNNFPEFTGRLCPAPCESACVLGINQPPVTIKNVEVSIIDKAWETGDVAPQIPERLSGKTVAVIGSGPAGLAAAQQLTRAATRWRCTSGRTASAACCATASPSSRWRSGTSTAVSSRCARRAPASAPAWRSAAT
ncbi:hypothetical protein GCM10020295_62820 [Streptomyces cinereospinus]